MIAQRQQEEIERVEAYIRRYKEGNRATMAKSREKMLARLEAQRVQAPRLDRVVKFTFPACPPSGREVITLPARPPFVRRSQCPARTSR